MSNVLDEAESMLYAEALRYHLLLGFSLSDAIWMINNPMPREQPDVPNVHPHCRSTYAPIMEPHLTTKKGETHE